MLKEALAANERELAHDIKDAMEDRFPSVPIVGRGGTETVARFRSVEKHFLTARDAYVWLVECFIGVKREVFTDIRWETTGYVAVGRQRTGEGEAIRNYFARSPRNLFLNSPWLAEVQSNYVRLSNGWFANTNLNNREKFDILLRFGWVVGLKYERDWDWEALDPSEELRDLKDKMIIGRRLLAELDLKFSQSSKT